jgi:hypothetical protein
MPKQKVTPEDKDLFISHFRKVHTGEQFYTKAVMLMAYFKKKYNREIHPQWFSKAIELQFLSDMIFGDGSGGWREDFDPVELSKKAAQYVYGGN